MNRTWFHVSGGGRGSGALALAAALMTAGCASTPSEAPAPGEPPSAEFRAHHQEILEHLGHIDARVSAFPGQAAEQQRAGMRFVVEFLNDHIRPHAAGEEKVLYPVVDARAGGGPNAFTATMRHEHRVVERWIDELAGESSKEAPDALKFARRTQRLLGLLEAHFESEEVVLLTLLDRTMTPEEFRTEITDRMGHD